MFKNKKKLENTSTTSKTFNYKNGEVVLNFTLRTDEKTQLKDFLVILKSAITEVEQEIEKQLWLRNNKNFISFENI